MKFEEYKPEYQAEVKSRAGEDIIKVETKKRKDKEVAIIDIAGVKIESLASQEEIQRVLEKIDKTPEAIQMLQTMALSFQQERGLITEGETSMGKTFLVNRFTEMMFGEGQKPIDFYCNGQTDTLSLMAKWVPETGDPADAQKWENFVNSPKGKKAFQNIIDTVRDEALEQETVIAQFVAIAAEAGIDKPVSNWKFQYGSLPRAMTLPEDPTKPVSESNPSRGMIMHVQEVGLAETHVIDALLQLGGEKGKMADDIQLWEDGGRLIKRGSHFWITYSTNPPENYPDRQGIDQALLRRNAHLYLGDLSRASKKLHIFRKNDVPSEHIPENIKKEIEKETKEKIIPLEKVEETENPYTSPEYAPVRALISETLEDFADKLQAGVKDKSIQNRTKQKMEYTLDHADMVFDFLRKFKSPDLEATLDRAVMLHYVNGLLPKGKEKSWELWEQIKDQMKFKEKLEKLMPKESSVEDVEALAELQEYQDQLEKEIEELEMEVDEYCKAEAEQAASGS